VSYTDRESLELKIDARPAWLVRFEPVPIQFRHRGEEKREEVALTCAIDAANGYWCATGVHAWVDARPARRALDTRGRIG